MSAVDGASDLLAAFKDIDLDTVSFLLDALESAVDCDSPEESLEAVLDPFLDDCSGALNILRTDPHAIDKAKKKLSANSFRASLFRETSGNQDSAVNPEFSPFIYPKRTYMDGAHNRAISLRQLRLVLAYMKESADADGYLPWIDQIKDSPNFGDRVHIETANLYHLVDFIVKPVTKKHKCSLVEILSKNRQQRPRWFVSHVWCEPVLDFLESLEEHARLRDVSEDDYYWVCGYANNQHDIDSDINIHPDPRQTSFYRAMQQCEGVLLCLDRKATPFTRIWCCFEEAMIVSEGKKSLLLDISAVVNGKGIVLTDGLVNSDLSYGPKFTLEAKRERETGFPLNLLEKGFSIDIRRASASHKPDIRRILNVIAGTPDINLILGAEPDLTNPAFERTNRALRGIFAEAAARKAAEVGRLGKVVEIIRSDIDRTALTLNLGGCQKIDLSTIESLAGHPKLERLLIDCSYCYIFSMAWIQHGIAQLPLLSDLTLIFSGCSGLNATSLKHLAGLKPLQKLNIDLSYSSISDVSGVADCLECLDNLKVLRLDFSCCNNLQDMSSLSRGLAHLKSLKEVDISFQYCDLSVSLKNGLEELQTLEKVFIDYSYTQTIGVESFVKNQKNLRQLKLSFEGSQCKYFHTIDNIQHLTKLEEFDLNLAYTNVGGATGIHHLNKAPNLSRVRLNFAKCAKLLNVSWLPQSIERVARFEVDFTECRGIPEILRTSFDKRDELVEAFSQVCLFPDTIKVGQSVQVFSKELECWISATVETLSEDGSFVVHSDALGSQRYSVNSKMKEKHRKTGLRYNYC